MYTSMEAKGNVISQKMDTKSSLFYPFFHITGDISNLNSPTCQKLFSTQRRLKVVQFIHGWSGQVGGDKRGLNCSNKKIPLFDSREWHKAELPPATMKIYERNA